MKRIRPVNVGVDLSQSFLCCSQSRLNPLRSILRLRRSGSFPSRINSTISGDRDVSRRMRPAYERSRPLAAASSSRLAYWPDSSCSCTSLLESTVAASALSYRGRTTEREIGGRSSRLSGACTGDRWCTHRTTQVPRLSNGGTNWTKSGWMLIIHSRTKRKPRLPG